MTLLSGHEKELLVNGYIHDEIQSLVSDEWIIPKDINNLCVQYSPDGEFFRQKGNNINVNAAKNIATGRVPFSAHRVYGNAIIDFKKTQASQIDITWKFKIHQTDQSDGRLYIGLDKANNKRLNDGKIPGSGYFFTNAGETYFGKGLWYTQSQWKANDVLEMTLSLNKKLYCKTCYTWNDWRGHQAIMRINGRYESHNPLIADDGENSCYQLAMIMSGNHRVELLDFKTLTIQ